jgi:hypothetical protein
LRAWRPASPCAARGSRSPSTRRATTRGTASAANSSPGWAKETVEALGLGDLLADAIPTERHLFHVREKPAGAVRAPGDRVGHQPPHARCPARQGLRGRGRNPQDAAPACPEDEAPAGRVFAAGTPPTGTVLGGPQGACLSASRSPTTSRSTWGTAPMSASRGSRRASVNVCGLFGKRDRRSAGSRAAPRLPGGGGPGALAEAPARGRPRPGFVLRDRRAAGRPPGGPSDRYRQDRRRLRLHPPFTGNGLAMALQGAELGRRSRS